MKRVFFFGVIAYSVAILLLNDWPGAINNTGTQALPWMAKCLVDLFFAGFGGYKLFGKMIHFDEDEVGIHEDDISVPDTWLYGLFGLNLLGNFGWHAYEFATETGATAFYYSLWFFGEAIAMLVTFVFYKHALIIARKEARKARNTSNTPVSKFDRNNNVA